MTPLPIEREEGNESGQTIILFAFAFLALLAFTALAVDAGFAFVRSSQFSRAVDSATLAGVVDLSPVSSGTAEADLRAAQFLAANSWPTPTLEVFTSTRSLTVDGIPQYTLTATWEVETFFIHLLGIDFLTVEHSATAAFYAQAEINTPTAFDDGRLKDAAQFIFGNDACTDQGDPVIPTQATPGQPNEDFTRFEGLYRYRIVVPRVYSPTQVQVELFDPDPYNTRTSESMTVTHTRAVTATGAFSDTESLSCTAGDGERCYVKTGENLYADNQNGFWFQRVDESWDSNCNPSSSTAQGTITTTFELYYIDNGTRVPLAAYRDDGSQAANTDMKWVTPCDTCTVQALYGNFEVDISGLPTDDRGRKVLQMDVTSPGGWSKNVWDIHARPNDFWYTSQLFAAPESDVNARNVQFANSSTIYSNEGIIVYALGRMPLENYFDGNDALALEIMPLDRQAGGGTIYNTIFDLDPSDPPPTVTYTIDTLPESVFRIEAKVDVNPDPTQFKATCTNGTNCDNSWMQPQYRMFVTDDPNIGFAGGNLIAAYQPDGDAHTISLSITAGRPFLTK